MKEGNKSERIQKQGDSKIQIQEERIIEKEKYKIPCPENDIEKIIIDFTPEGIVQGFVFSVIIGKPKSRQRGRWY